MYQQVAYSQLNPVQIKRDLTKWYRQSRSHKEVNLPYFQCAYPTHLPIFTTLSRVAGEKPVSLLFIMFTSVGLT